MKKNTLPASFKSRPKALPRRTDKTVPAWPVIVGALDPVPAKPAKGGFPVVGVGASAGGLAAFEAFFSAMPPDTDPGIAFVLVQHLAPDHKSILTELIKRYTRMKAYEVTDGMTVRPNCAYIIPPNRDMAFLDGALHLLEPISPRSLRLPIDYFFRSLAQDQHERAICIVLSGTGSDGTLGLRRSKARAAWPWPRAPKPPPTTACRAAPSPPAWWTSSCRRRRCPPSFSPTSGMPSGGAHRQVPPCHGRTEDTLKKVFVLLRNQTGHDFSQYKPNTIARRVERRMAVHQIEAMSDYVTLSAADTGRSGRPVPRPADRRHQLLPRPGGFEALEEEGHSAPLRAARPRARRSGSGCPGCSTGEEAYSIAILLQEQHGSPEAELQGPVFATDIDGRAIETARAGVYPGSIAADIRPSGWRASSARNRTAGTYRIRKAIRDMLVFAEQT